MTTLFFFAGCGASGERDPAVEVILTALEAEYPLEQLSDPLIKGAKGGLNVWAYCLALGYPAVGYQKGYIEGPGAARDNWVCQRGTAQLAPQAARPIDMDAACAWQFGRPGMVARPSEEDHAWSWDCYSA